MRFKKNSLTILAVALTTIYIVPVLWMVWASFMQEKDILASRWIPTRLSLENYEIMTKSAKIGRWFMNSLITASLGTLGILVVGIPAAYSVSRMRYPGRRLLYFIALSGFAIPGYSTMIPLYLMLRKFGLVNNLLGLILPAIPSSLAVFILAQFMKEIPLEYEEAARLDGASDVQILLRIFVPMSFPAIVTVTIFHFTGLWNDFLWPLILMTKKEMYTLPVGLVAFAGANANRIQYGSIIAACAIASLPVIIIYIFLQRYLVKGLVIGLK